MNLELRLVALAAALAFVALPPPTLGGTLTVSGISTTGPANFELSVPTVEATDANLDEAAIRALFGGADTDYAASLARLADLDATAIRIPEIIFSYDVPDPAAPGGTTRAKIIYRDLVLNNVADGVASGATLGGIEIMSTADTAMTLGAMTTDLFDLGAILGFYGLDADASPADGMKPIYRNFAFEGGSLTGPGVTCTIGGGRADQFSARPLNGNFADLMLLSGEVQAAEATGGEPSPEVLARLLAFYSDFLTAFQSTPMTFDGLACNAVDPGTNGTIIIKSGAVTIGGFEPGIYPAFAFNDLAIEHSSEGFLNLGNFTWKPMDLNGPLGAIREAGSVDFKWFEANWRKLIPAFGGFSLAGFAVDITDPETPGERIVASIGAFDLTLGQYVNGIPATVSASGTDLKVRIPASAVPELTALGLTEPLIDYEIAVQWDEEARQFLVHHLGFGIDGFGGVSITGTIANAGPELFSEDLKVVEAAAMALTVTELSLEIDNQGLMPALIALTAAEEKQRPEIIHATIIGTAAALPIAMLGATDEATKLAAALGAFATGTPRLSITLTSIDPKGIGLADLMAAEDDPTALKGKFAITASASGEPVPFTFPQLSQPETPTEPEVPVTDDPSRTVEPPVADGPAPVGGPAPQTEANPRTGESPMN